jgi:hypothetical protein
LFFDDYSYYCQGFLALICHGIEEVISGYNLITEIRGYKLHASICVAGIEVESSENELSACYSTVLLASVTETALLSTSEHDSALREQIYVPKQLKKNQVFLSEPIGSLTSVPFSLQFST